MNEFGRRIPGLKMLGTDPIFGHGHMVYLHHLSRSLSLHPIDPGTRMTFKSASSPDFGSRVRGLNQTPRHQVFENSAHGAFTDAKTMISLQKDSNFSFSIRGVLSTKP